MEENGFARTFLGMIMSNFDFAIFQIPCLYGVFILVLCTLLAKKNLLVLKWIETDMLSSMSINLFSYAR